MTSDLRLKGPAERKGPPQHDPIRRQKVAAAEKVSGIPLVIYASDFTDAGRAGQNGPGIQIDADDRTGFLQALSDIDPGPLDVLLHSPGGSPTATESIVHLLRIPVFPDQIHNPSYGEERGNHACLIRRRDSSWRGR